MQAIQIDRTGGPEVMQLVEVPVRDPGPGEVRIRHRAIGANFIDTYFRTGLYPTQLPAILGSEGAGIVDAVGADVTHLSVGDRVGYAARTQGSYAQLRTLDATPVVRLHLASREAAGEMSRELFDMVTSGQIHIEVGQRHALADAAQAHRDLEARNTTGSTILLP